MTTTPRRRPRWAFAAMLAAAAGCGQPPPMVHMSPPGAGGDELAVDVNDDAYKAKALGETALSQRPGRGDDAEQAETTREAVPVLEPTAPGEEVEVDSGLVYSTIEQGDPAGKMAQVGDSITVYYEGKLDDGFIFDSNMGEEPIDFPLQPGGLIEGWVQGIPGMKVGERRKLVIPADLGYGERGSPPSIPPGATLTFEVKLVDVQKGG